MLVFTGIALIFTGIWYINAPPAMFATAENVLFTVPRGKGVSYIAKTLEEQKLIKSALFFIFLARVMDAETKFKAGVYEIQTSMGTWDILQLLLSGKVKMIQFTIVEGWTNFQIGQYFTELGFVPDPERFLEITGQPEILRKYRIHGTTTEGFLFPETYTIDPQLSIHEIHEIMIKMFYRKLSSIVDPGSIPPEELYKKVIIASIIEREYVHKEELPLMASVYYNRLKKGMKLQADPTIQYILKQPKKKLTFRDLEIDSPYNTYKYRGLPPTPIANPGLESLKAAFFPAETEYLFFVRIADGKHHFSKTYSEHLKAKSEYWDKQK